MSFLTFLRPGVTELCVYQFICLVSVSWWDSVVQTKIPEVLGLKGKCHFGSQTATEQ
jgi:hypothetical protein